jgi:hypothetical protein
MESTQNIADEYQTKLLELTFNSKPIINKLTICAGENIQAAETIVRLIEKRVKEVYIYENYSLISILWLFIHLSKIKPSILSGGTR